MTIIFESTRPAAGKNISSGQPKMHHLNSIMVQVLRSDNSVEKLVPLLQLQNESLALDRAAEAAARTHAAKHLNLIRPQPNGYAQLAGGNDASSISNSRTRNYYGPILMSDAHEFTSVLQNKPRLNSILSAADYTLPPVDYDCGDVNFQTISFMPHIEPRPDYEKHTGKNVKFNSVVDVMPGTIDQ